VLNGAFDLDASRIARILYSEGFTAPEAGAVLRDLFGRDAAGAASLLNAAGFSGLETSRALMEGFNLDTSGIAQVLLGEEFSGIEVGAILRDLYFLDPAAAAQVLKDAGFPVGEIVQMLRDVPGYSNIETARLLLNVGFEPIQVTLALRDSLELDAYSAGQILKSLGSTEFAIQSLLIEVYDVYAVIVDIKSTINNNPAPEGYTGIGECYSSGRVCTEPYIPGLFGEFVSPMDINKGIGGDFRYVYVKYELVPRTSAQRVVTGIMAAHWPDWKLYCPAGWNMVDLLTTKTTNSSCWRIGMCARYEPFVDAQTFITNVTVSYGAWANPASKCPGLCGSNANIWPLYTDSRDIHSGCEDERWGYFCYNRALAWPTRPKTIEVSDDEKLSLLEQYAPRVFIHPNESFYPSSVEWSFDHLLRYTPNEIYEDAEGERRIYIFPPPDARYYLVPKDLGIEPSPSIVLEYFYGCNGSATAHPCTLSDAPAYAFWHEQTISWGGEKMEVADLTYFFYFPYNRGKEYYDTIWGNHVGDWEHITVRLGWVYDSSAGWQIKPLHLFVSAHDFGTSHPWDTIATVPGSDHPVVYSAEGGHGLYVNTGTQRYWKIWTSPIPIFLYDDTGIGAQWDTWNNLETYDYDARLGLGSSSWPRWMSTDYTASCAPDNPGCDPHDPASGPVYRWGGYKFGTCYILGLHPTDTGCRMVEGPTGPADKKIWTNPYEP
jgi:hypothetical protein